MEQSQYVRPMGLGEILDASVRLYREKFRDLVIAQLPLTLFFIVYEVVIFYVGTGIFSFLVFNVFTGSYTEELVQNFLIILFLWIFWVAFMYPITLAAVTKIASDTVLNTPSSVKDAYRFCLRNWVKFALTNAIITFFIVIARDATIYTIAFLRLLPGPLAYIIDNYWVFFILSFIAYVVGTVISAFLLIRWVATFPIMVTEDTFAVRALKRSWGMVKGKTLKTLFVIIIIFLIPGILQYSPEILELSLQRSLAVLNIVFDIVALGLLVPVVSCARVVIYFELKARKEGFDLEKKVEELQ